MLKSGLSVGHSITTSKRVSYYFALQRSHAACQRVKRCFAWSSQSVCCCVVYLMKVSERMCQENDVPLRLQLRRPCTITTAIAVPPLIAWSRRQAKSLGLVFVYLCALTRFQNWNQRAGASSIPQESVDVSEKVDSPMWTQKPFPGRRSCKTTKPGFSFMCILCAVEFWCSK